MNFRDIKIRAKTNGVEVEVGCWRLVYSDMAQFHKDLRNYLKNPGTTEKELRKRWKIKERAENQDTWVSGNPLHYTTGTNTP